MASTENENAFPMELGEYVDEVEESNRSEVRLLEGKQGFELLSLFIGGFEHWPQLIDDCKRKVVEFLDYESRCKLARCSKADHELVESTPIHVDCINLVDNEEIHPEIHGSLDNLESVVIRVIFDNHPTNPHMFELVFSQDNADTLVRWVTSARRADGFVVPNRNFREKSFEFFEHWLKKCQFGVKELSVEMSKYPHAESKINFLPNCKTVRLAADDLDVFTWWLQKCPLQPDKIELEEYETEEDLVLTSEFLELPQIMNAAMFDSHCKTGFTDEQFVRLKARRTSLIPARITDEGINAFLRKWARGEGPPGFVKTILWSGQEMDEHKVLEGLRVRPWDSAFRREARGFCEDYDRCCGEGSCYQVSSYVEPYSSVTVAFYTNFYLPRFCIYATGKKWHVNGRDGTDYSVVV